MGDSNVPLVIITLIIIIAILCVGLIQTYNKLESAIDAHDCNTDLTDEERCIIVNGLFHNISESPRGSRQRVAGMDLLNKLHWEDCK